MIELLAMIGAAFSLSLGVMTIAWCVYVIREVYSSQKKANIVDVAWAVAFMASSWAYLFIGSGYAPKRWLMALMVTVWAVRLGKHLFERYVDQPEDVRYAGLRSEWGGDSSNLLFLMMFLMQGSMVVILSTPFLIVSHNATAVWSGWELLGFLLWAVGVAGESASDFQLAQFKADPQNAGKVMNKGFWRYSRHPNYFFEWVLWLGFFFFAFPSQGGWFALISPVFIFCLLTRGSGVPLTELQALQSKGDAYRDYQRVTQPFFPWFPKEKPIEKEDVDLPPEI